MNARLSATLALAAVLLLVLGSPASMEPAKKNLLKELGLPTFPNAKLVTEINLPAGKLLDTIVRDVGSWLGLQEIEQLNVLSYAIEAGPTTEEVFRFYEPAITSQEWKTLLRSFDREDGAAILFHEKKGMLIMNIDSPKKQRRQMTFVRLFGKMDPAKLGSSEKKIPAIFKKMFESAISDAPPGDVQNASRIPIGRPISVPPAEKLHIKATRSDISARVLDQNTAEIRLAARVADPGELVRIDERLVLALTPKIALEEVILPGTIPLLLELTEGSLTLTGGPGPNDRPVQLSVISTGAPVTIESFALVSGTHLIKTINGAVDISFSKMQGGNIIVAVTGEDVTLAIPRDASVDARISVSDGKIENLLPTEIHTSRPDEIGFRMGAGKAQLAVQVVNGTVCIKSAD